MIRPCFPAHRQVILYKCGINCKTLPLLLSFSPGCSQFSPLCLNIFQTTYYLLGIHLLKAKKKKVSVKRSGVTPQKKIIPLVSCFPIFVIQTEHRINAMCIQNYKQNYYRCLGFFHLHEPNDCKRTTYQKYEIN